MGPSESPRTARADERFPSRALLAELLTRPEDEIPLAGCALLVASEEFPGLDVPAYVDRLDDMGRALEERIPHGADPARALQELNAYLFEEERFTGNRAAHLDPSNSLLNCVLDRKLGIPLTLSIVYIEVGRRVGLPLHGVSFPGHFLVRYDGEDGTTMLDPWAGGATLSERDLKVRLDRVYGGRLALEEAHVRPARACEMVTRLLVNLKASYFAVGLLEKGLWVQDLLVLVNPSSAGELRDRGMIHLRLGNLGRALDDLRRYRTLAPSAPDAREVDQRIEELVRMLQAAG